MRVEQATKEIFLYDAIGPAWAGMVSASEFVEALGQFRGQDVNIRINSPGGSADDGLAMYNALLRHDGKVTTWNDALAASAASIVFLGGSVRNVAKASRVMIHRAMWIAIGNASDFEKATEILNGYDQDIVELYVDRAGIEAGEVTQMMADETWMRSADALKHGFATAIVEGNKDVDPASVPENWYKKTPQMYLKPANKLQFVKQRVVGPETSSRLAKAGQLTGRKFGV